MTAKKHLNVDVAREGRVRGGLGEGGRLTSFCWASQSCCFMISLLVMAGLALCFPMAAGLGTETRKRPLYESTLPLNVGPITNKVKRNLSWRGATAVSDWLRGGGLPTLLGVAR